MSKGLPFLLVGSRVWAASKPPRSAGGFPYRRLLPPPGLSPPPATSLHAQRPRCRGAHAFPHRLGRRSAACPTLSLPRPAGTATGPSEICRHHGALPAFAWRSQLRTYGDGRPESPKSPEEKRCTAHESESKDAKAASPGASAGASEGDAESITASVSKYLHLPKMPHRPTKEELLEAANGFWERVRVRFKWMSIRSMRPWNVDEWGAFVSWFMLGHLVWILVGTTTFFSLLIFSINTVFAQGESRGLNRPSAKFGACTHLLAL